MSKLTGGQAAVQSLINHGVDTIFGLPGVQNDWLFNALYDARDKIRVIHTRHEQGAAYMALGYALATGKVGVFSVVPGPGLLNASAALATAYGLSAPVFCLTGQIPSHQIGKGRGLLHELPDQLAILRQLTKWADRANTPAEIPPLIAQAFHQMRSGRPRPVGLEIPLDVLAAQTEVTFETAVPLPFHLPLDQDLIRQAAQALSQAQNPLIYVGGGAQNVGPEVTELAKLLQAPVIGYRTGKGVIDGRHFLAQEQPPSHELWKTTDAVLLVGTYGRIPLQKWGVDQSMSLIKIDVDPTTHAIYHPPDIAITARAEDALPQLVRETAKVIKNRPSRETEFRTLKTQWAEQTAYLEPQNSYLKCIREALGEDGIFVDELTQVGFVSRINYPAYKPRTYISTGYMGTLGYGFPTALGIKVAYPNLPVVAVSGDGGFMFGVQELATAVQHQIGLVVLLFNNNQYGNVQQMQKELYDGRVIATDLRNPDFVQMAKAFGANGIRVDSVDQLGAVLQEGFKSTLPTLVEIPIGDVPSVDRFRSLGKVR